MATVDVESVMGIELWFLSKSINTIELIELSARTSSSHPSEIASPDPQRGEFSTRHTLDAASLPGASLADAIC